MKRRKFIQHASVAGLALSFAPFACTPKLDTEVIILGGGISGLYLAYLLEKAGKDYILLEGSERLGGRMFYREDINRDVGGRGIGDGYTHIMSLVKELEVETVDITSFARKPSAIYVGGNLYPEWPDPATNPAMLEFMGLSNAPKLTKLNGWYQRPDLDQTYSDYLKGFGKTEKEIELINISANYNDIRETSSINSLHSSAFRQFNGTKRLLNFKGGTKTLIQAVNKQLKKPVHTKKMAVEIKDTATGVEVLCEDGTKYRSKKLASTLPLTTLRDVKLDINLNSNQQKAIEQIEYTLITQLHLEVKKPFWEDDGAPMGMWTDTHLERIMDTSSDPNNHAMVCWVNGKGTAFFDDMSESEIADYTLKTFKEIRPASEGNLEFLGSHKWGKYRYNKGAYVEFAPGQAAWFEDMIRPAGNVHFAGEHAAKNSRGMEGAAESAQRVFDELMNKQ